MLILPQQILKETFDMLNECGKGRCECVVYWTGSVDVKDAVDGRDHPTHRRSPYGYQIDDQWLTRYWFRLGYAKRAIRAQIHTHPGAAFHSATDDHWPIISQPEFISIVIPNFAAGPKNLDGTWAGRLSSDGFWEEVPISKIIQVIT